MTINIQKRLHHRPPYLMVDEVIEHSNTKIHARKNNSLKDEYIKGHFPNAMVVPGAMMQEMATQTAGLLIAEYYSPVSDYDSEKTKGHALGVLRAVHHAKYKKFVKPNQTLDIKVELVEHLDNLFRFKAHIEVENALAASLEFSLINISDEQLLN